MTGIFSVISDTEEIVVVFMKKTSKSNAGSSKCAKSLFSKSPQGTSGSLTIY